MNTHKKIAFGLVALFVLCLALTATAGAIYQAVTSGVVLFPAGVSTNAETTLRAEYYRGAYDVCSYFWENTGGDPNETPKACNEFIGRMRESDWYETESKGYEP